MFTFHDKQINILSVLILEHHLIMKLPTVYTISYLQLTEDTCHHVYRHAKYTCHTIVPEATCCYQQCSAMISMITRSFPSFK